MGPSRLGLWCVPCRSNFWSTTLPSRFRGHLGRSVIFRGRGIVQRRDNRIRHRGCWGLEKLLECRETEGANDRLDLAHRQLAAKLEPVDGFFVDARQVRQFSLSEVLGLTVSSEPLTDGHGGSLP